MIRPGSRSRCFTALLSKGRRCSPSDAVPAGFAFLRSTCPCRSNMSRHREPPPAPGLLVSVRSAAEARAALDGGAALIDIKEPARGPLGRADDGVMAEV